MNDKMAINTYYEQLNLKNKLSEQEEQRQNCGYEEGFEWLPDERGCGGMGEEVGGLRSTNGSLENSQEDVKYSIGNGVAKELIRMTHGHEQWCGDCLRRVVLGGEGQNGKN